MKLDAAKIKEKLNLSVGNNQVEIVVTNNLLAAQSHIFETDGLFIITFNESKINDEKELNDLIKATRNRINVVTPQVGVLHRNVKKAIEEQSIDIKKTKEKKIQKKVASTKKSKIEKQKPLKNRTQSTNTKNRGIKK